MIFDQIFLGITLTTVGSVLLGIAVILVHGKVVKEHGIDGKVIKEMRRERNVAFVGILFIILGYLLEVLTLFELALF